ncbi:hypothetical protein MTO96_051810 [Rhipicephalus appendiculatus]
MDEHMEISPAVRRLLLGVLTNGANEFRVIAGARKQVIQHSLTVYPQVFEDREDESKKLLVIHEGLSMELSKGSVLSESVLLRDLTESGVKETYIDGRQHEKDLYQDVETQASLLLQPQEAGHYHIVGLINSTHLIEPIGRMERSSVAGIAHRIAAIPEHKGIIGALKADRLAYTGSACRYLKVGVAVDYPGYYMAVNIITHELSHSLNASHDGQKDAKNCSGEHEHLMNTHVGGKQNHLYSSCSKRSIRKFLMSKNGSCLRHKINEGYVFEVPYTYLQRKAPFLNGIDYCQRFFPDYSEVEYVEIT